jgi:hypothetical protein
VVVVVCSVVINRQLIYNYPEQLFTDAGVVSIEHADFEGVERLALVLGAEIASTFDSPQTTKLGYCDLIEEIVIGEDKVIRFSGVSKGEACTVVLRGASKRTPRPRPLPCPLPLHAAVPLLLPSLSPLPSSLALALSVASARFNLHAF